MMKKLVIDNGQTIMNQLRGKGHSFVRVVLNEEGILHALYVASNRKARRFLKSKRCNNLGLKVDLELNTIS